jgi:hypothetical protein
MDINFNEDEPVAPAAAPGAANADNAADGGDGDVFDLDSDPEE